MPPNEEEIKLMRLELDFLRDAHYRLVRQNTNLVKRLVSLTERMKKRG